MAHRFRVREIALQAGLSEATVDRALHQRAGVRASTVAEVQRAIAELERQQTQLRIGRRAYVVDLVMQTPARFGDAVRAALEHALPSLEPALLRARFHLTETGPPSDLVATLDAVVRRGSHGVLLKAPDVPEVVEAVDRVVAAGIPVLTLVTDLPTTGRYAYVGMDDRAAGATAAYLVEQWLGDSPGDVLVTLSSASFRGEEEREIGFRSALRGMRSSRRVVDVTEGSGLDEVQRELVLDALRGQPDVTAVYSVGGGNRATLDAFDQLGRRAEVFVAHDLDADNRQLLAQRRLSAVLHHDLDEDLRRACRLVVAAQEGAARPDASPRSAVQVVTPFNLPASRSPD